MTGATLSVEARDQLHTLIQRYGRDLARHASRVGGLLRDTVGQYRLEISLILAAAEEGIAAELERDPAVASVPGRLSQLARRLESGRGLSAENARWAVETWAFALTPEEVPETAAEEEPAPMPAEEPGPTAAEAEPPSPEPVGPPPPEAPGPPEPPEPPWLRGPQPAPSPPFGAAEIPPTPSRPGRGKAVVAAVIAGVVVIIGAGVVLAARGGNPEAAPSPTPTVNQSPSTGPTTTPVTSSPQPPPQVQLNRPSNLSIKAGPASLHPYVTLSWKRPSHGEKPASYSIYRGSTLVKTTKALTWTDRSVAWGQSYTYNVRSLLGSKRSEPGTRSVAVPNPPNSEARLEGSGTFFWHVTNNDFGIDANFAHNANMTFKPTCASGPCSVHWTGTHHLKYSTPHTSGTLNRSGGSYSGTYRGFFGNYCKGNRATATLTIKITVGGAGKIGTEWRVTAFTGTAQGSIVCSGKTYRYGYSFTGSLP